MSSFKQVQKDLLLCYCQNIISDKEYFILSDLHRPKNLDLPYDEYPLFDLESMLNDECKTEFRFEKIIIIIIIIITLFNSQIILAEHECSTNWGDCKSNKLNQIN